MNENKPKVIKRQVIKTIKTSEAPKINQPSFKELDALDKTDYVKVVEKTYSKKTYILLIIALIIIITIIIFELIYFGGKL